MSDKVDLRVDWCSHEAAKYAVEKWHYSKTMPRTKLLKIGAWENGDFIGCVIINNSANNGLGAPYGLTQHECVELVRVALKNSHISSVSEIVAKCLKLLKGNSPGLRLIVSFADPDQGHHGGIYQAGNWLYAGMTQPSDEYIVNGKRYQGRALRATRSSSRRGGVEAQNTLEWARKVLDPHAERVEGSSKHRYLYPLDRAMRKQIAPLAKPYPKRVSCGQSVEGDTVGDQPTEAGSIPAARSVMK